MPAFIVISGYFSKNKSGDLLINLKKIVINLLIPYIVFQLIYSIFNSYFLEGSGLSINFITPYWIMWFLLSLFFWRVLVLLINFKDKFYFLYLSFIIAILSGYIEIIGYPLSISRTIVFFPFFLMGYFLKKKHFKNLSLFLPFKQKLFVSGIVYTIEGLFFYYILKIQAEWFYGSLSYLDLGYPEWYAGGYRLLVILLAIINGMLFFWLIPDNKTFYSYLGRNTIYPYILHGFIVKIFLLLGIYSHINTALDVVVLIFTVILFLVILSSKFTQKYLEC